MYLFATFILTGMLISQSLGKNVSMDFPLPYQSIGAIIWYLHIYLIAGRGGGGGTKCYRKDTCQECLRYSACFFVYGPANNETVPLRYTCQKKWSFSLHYKLENYITYKTRASCALPHILTLDENVKADAKRRRENRNYGPKNGGHIHIIILCLTSIRFFYAGL